MNEINRALHYPNTVPFGLSIHRFTSNPYFEGGLGFQLKYESTNVDPQIIYRIGGCGGSFTSPNGHLTSPSHPDNYPSYQDCVYTISHPTDTLILLKFHTMDIERCSHTSHTTCSCDYLEIRDGTSADSLVLDKLCGDKTPSPIQFSQNEVWMK